MLANIKEKSLCCNRRYEGFFPDCVSSFRKQIPLKCLLKIMKFKNKMKICSDKHKDKYLFLFLYINHVLICLRILSESFQSVSDYVKFCINLTENTAHSCAFLRNTRNKRNFIASLGDKGDLFRAESENTSEECEGVLARQKIGDRCAWWMEIALHIFPSSSRSSWTSRALLVLQCRERRKQKSWNLSILFASRMSV